MQLAKVAVSNYRNLDGLEIEFSPGITFVVGENELGKSNLLDLLDTVFNQRSFSEDDFSDRDSPIEVRFSLSLSEDEKGAFEDIFDPDESDLVNAVAVQDPLDLFEQTRFLRQENEKECAIEIPARQFRSVNFLKYDSMRAPRDELTFHRGRGSGRLLSYLVRDFVDREEDPSGTKYIVAGSMDELIEHIDGILSRLKPLKNQGLGLFTNLENPADLLSRMLKLKGADGFEIERSGCGVQFSAVLILSILERLMHLRLRQDWANKVFEARREYFTEAEFERFCKRFPQVGEDLEHFVTREAGQVRVNLGSVPDVQRELGHEAFEELRWSKHISLVLGLDEPEIHLHPYRQRSLIKYISDVLNNKDDDFCQLLKEMFGVDRLNGQAMVVSHSPNVLLDDYRQIVRFYREKGGVRAVSGARVSVGDQEKKHFLMNLPYIKEAFFSRCVIVVEGATELGALAEWAERLLGDADEFGIAVVKVDGVGSVRPVMAVLREFKIANVGVIDRDSSKSVKSSGDLYVTSFRDFEEELFETVEAANPSLAPLFSILQEYDTRGMHRRIQRASLEKVVAKYSVPETWKSIAPGKSCSFSKAQELGDKNLLKAMFLAWMSTDDIKTISFARFLAQTLDPGLIPAAYRTVIETARAKAECANG